jgi:hypothetical protein
MRPIPISAALALAATGLSGCGPSVTGPDAAEPPPQAQAAAPVLPPFKPVASVLDLMRSTITVSAETVWESVSIVVDVNGITEHAPEGDEGWRLVWAAGVTLSESGNLLMMAPRALDDGDWMRYSEALVDAGAEAASAAQARDFEGLLDIGETIYNACLDCHQAYVPALPDL